MFFGEYANRLFLGLLAVLSRRNSQHAVNTCAVFSRTNPSLPRPNSYYLHILSLRGVCACVCQLILDCVSVLKHRNTHCG